MSVSDSKYDTMVEVTYALLSALGKPLKSQRAMRSARPYKSLRLSQYYWASLVTENCTC